MEKNNLIIPLPSKVQGSILILVLWMISLGIILVTAIAANIRLSAMTVVNQSEALQDWGTILETVNKAHMELIISKMPKINSKKTSLYNRDSEESQFDGRPILLSYDQPDNIIVRIYDLSGKISINNLKKDKLQKLLEHQLGETNKKIPGLVDAWLDWIDADNLKRLNGAEESYYKKEKSGYQPRNGKFIDVNEILLIKGFANVFNKVGLDSIFSLWGSEQGSVNPNIASKEVLLALPGMNERLANELINARSKQHFKNMSELNVILTPVATTKLAGWFHFKESNYYSIFVYAADREQKNKKSQDIYGYMEEVRVGRVTEKIQVLKVNPYSKITISSNKQ